MPVSAIVGDSRYTVNEFFSGIAAGFSQGLSTIGSTILPNWAATQLGLQSQDQLKDDMYQWPYSPPRVDAVQSTQQTNGQGFLQTSLFQFGTFNFTGGTLIILTIAVLGVAYFFKRM